MGTSERATRFGGGARRRVPPEATFARIAPLARAIGVTRLADVTGLDRIGIPTWQAIRPQARSLSVSQGKGLTHATARVSALMEAIELHCAERLVAESHGPATAREAAIWARMTVAAGQDRPFAGADARGWVNGTDLTDDAPLRVPLGLVSMDCTCPREPDLWPNTNGLAAGNDRTEALTAALCEAIERDGHARWMAVSPAARRATAIDPNTIDGRAGRWLLARVARAGLRCALWDISDAHGIATIGCAIIEPGASTSLALPPAFGAGCHPRATVALTRAITEAAQTRIALIAGARDDLSPADYADPSGQRSALLFATRDFGGGAMRHWRSVPNLALADGMAEQDHLLRLCGEANGVVACIDLAPPGADISVVRVIVPGFGDHDRPPA